MIFVGFKIGGLAAQKARQFVFEQRVLQNEIQAANKGFPSFATPIPPIENFSNLPFSEADFSEWLAAKLGVSLSAPHSAKCASRCDK